MAISLGGQTKGGAGAASRGRLRALRKAHRKQVAMARKLIAAGQLGAAEKLCTKVLAEDPGSEDALYTRAIILKMRGQVDVAAAVLDRLIAAGPADSDIYNDRVAIHCDAKNFAAARKLAAIGLEADPRNPRLHLNLGNALASLREWAPAEAAYAEALRLRPGNANALRGLAAMQYITGRSDLAAQSARAAIRLEPKHALGHARLSEALGQLGHFAEAIEAAQAALDLDPNDPANHEVLARALSDFGDLEQARAILSAAIERFPDQPTLHYTLAHLSTYRERTDHVDTLEGLFATQTLEPEGRGAIGFALAKAYDGMGEHEKAFEVLVEANAEARKTIGYSQNRLLAKFQQMQLAYTPAVISRHADAGCPDDTPIFVIGMPRSGTSLTEQILASHPEVEGAGELSLFEISANRLRDEMGARNQVDLVNKVTPEALTRLGENYVEGLRAYSPDARHIVDKMPNNFGFVGLIKLALPNAKIIHCVRDPLDTCISNFKLFFGHGSQGFSYNMKELGTYHRAYRALMAHWHDALPGEVFDLEYEALVADQEAQSRALIEWCGLPWDAACLKFYESARPTRTASKAQVRQPIYKSAVGKAQRYGEAIQPLVEALRLDAPDGDLFKAAA